MPSKINKTVPPRLEAEGFVWEERGVFRKGLWRILTPAMSRPFHTIQKMDGPDSKTVKWFVDIPKELNEEKTMRIWRLL